MRIVKHNYKKEGIKMEKALEKLTDGIEEYLNNDETIMNCYRETFHRNLEKLEEKYPEIEDKEIIMDHLNNAGIAESETTYILY